jgi:hypothetical protein
MEENFEEIIIIPPAPDNTESLFIEDQKIWEDLQKDEFGLPVNSVIVNDTLVIEEQPVVGPPFSSWILDENGEWIAPVPEPKSIIIENEDGSKNVTTFVWDEDLLNWEKEEIFLPAPIRVTGDPDYYTEDGEPRWYPPKNLPGIQTDFIS